MRRWWGALLLGPVLGLLIACGEQKSAPFAAGGSGAGGREREDSNENDADDESDSNDSHDDTEDDPSDEEPADDADDGPPEDDGAAGRAPNEDDPDPDTDDPPLEEPVPSPEPMEVVQLLDPEGDAEQREGMLRYVLDLLEVTLETQDDELIARLRFARDLDEHFAFPGVNGERTAGAPAELYLDLDGDPSTGVTPTWANESPHASELVGYELELNVVLAYTFRTKEDGSEGYGGGDVILDTDDVELTGYFANYWFLDQTEGYRLGPSDSDAGFEQPDTRDLTAIDGDEIILRVPLDWLDLESGDVVRVMYSETDQGGASGAGYSRNARLLVR